MTQIGFKKMNWMPKPSAWNEHLQKLAKRREMMREFESKNMMLLNSFANISAAQINGSVDNVARTASDRIIAEGKAKVDSEYAKLSGGLNKTA